MGVIGESGCGKSVTARAIMQMVPKPGKVPEGEVIYYRRVKGPSGADQTEIVNITKLTTMAPRSARSAAARSG